MNLQNKKFISNALAAKARDIIDLVKETFRSLERIVALFAFENKNNKISTNLTKEEYDKLYKLRLLKNNRGTYQECSAK